MSDEIDPGSADAQGVKVGRTRESASEAGPEIRGNGAIGEQPVELIEIAGVIKWFDVAKGFGFIVPDNGLPDVLLHVTCLRRDGYQTAAEGARIVVEAVQRPRGYQAFRILSLDETAAVHPSELPMARTHVSVTPTSGLELAVCKWFNRLRGIANHVWVLLGDGELAEGSVWEAASVASHVSTVDSLTSSGSQCQTSRNFRSVSTCSMSSSIPDATTSPSRVAVYW